ncbi:MAG: class I SAM-dependent methyltransferase [Dehalococcoidia bacterium]|nr:class I SAM-dependent methyltransferase [Dehalococcoidia bacterium]
MLTADHDFGRPSAFLVRNISLLPPGRILDIAMGRGRDALYLAKKGFSVEGVDISAEAVGEAVERSLRAGFPIKGTVADLEKGYPIQPETYEVIICFHYLQRSLFPEIKSGLKKGGVVVYETFTLEQRRFGKPRNPDFLLRKGELREVFGDFECLRYREGIINNSRAIASIIARK